MSFDYQHQTFVDVKCQQVIGKPALGRFILEVEFLLTLHPHPASPVLTDLSGELSVAPAGPRVSPMFVSHFVRANAPIVFKAGADVFNVPIRLQVFLDHPQVEAIEDIRAGRGLDFQCQLWGRMVPGVIAPGERVESIAGERCSLELTQSDWIRVLSEMGYRRTMLLEVPIPEGNSGALLAGARVRLASAQTQMLRGEWREAVGLCRDVTDEINHALGEDDIKGGSVDWMFENSRAMTKRDRLRVLRRAIKLLTHPARHVDDVTVHFEWTRDDALALVAMTAALIQETERERS